MEANIHVYTFKEGLLSKLAHDLRLSVGRFEISARGTEVSARFEVPSLRVDGAMKDGRLSRSELSESDKQKIQDTLQRDVLRAREHGEVRFTGRTSSREPPFALEGELTLCGVARPISFLLLMRGDRLVADIDISPTVWGIKPFRALGGTLRLQDRVRVAIDASAEWLSHSAELNPAVQLVWTATTRPSVVRSSMRPGS
jgi:hypothetical protein